jgi:hypothetical protein
VPIGQHLAWHGRLSPGLALDIGRQLASALAGLETTGIVHGEIAASSLWMDSDGGIQLARTGWTSALRFERRMANESLLEDLDYLPPERLLDAEIRANQGPTVAADIYAYGCLLWHLLAGRTPFAGGDAASKSRAICRGRVPDIRQIAPDVAPKLVGLIEQCMRREPAERPQSFSSIVEHLGLPASAPRREVVHLVSRTHRTIRRRWNQLGSGAKRSARVASTMAACAALVLIATWPMWRTRPAPRQRGVATDISIAKTDKPRALTDAGVRLANYQTPTEKLTNPEGRQPAAPVAPVIELPAAETASVTIRLAPHAVVRSAGNGRATIIVPANGWAISSDDVHFENIDFLWRQRAEQITSPESNAIIDLRAATAEFTGCTFQAISSDEAERPSAIRLTGAAGRVTLLPAMRVRVTKSVLRGVAEGIDCRSRGPTAIELVNTLHMGPGPMIRIPELRPPDASMNIAMEHVTLRGAACAVELNGTSAGDSSGSISVNATACVFAPDSNGALVVLDDRHGQQSSNAVLKSIDWSGQGSLIVPEVSVAIARSPAGDKAIADGELALEGIVASALEFSGQAANSASNSQVQKWLAPLRTDQPPGIAGDLPVLPSFSQFVTAASK